MKKYWNKLAFVAVTLILAVSLVACSDDDDGEINKWNATYAYLIPENLGILESNYTLPHGGDGGVNEGKPTESTFQVALNKVSDKDITVNLEMELSETLPADKITLTAAQVTIPAGTLSVPITFSVPDWSFEENNREKTEYSVVIKLADPVGKSDLLLGLQSSLKFVITKNAFLNMSFSTSSTSVPGTSVSDTERKAWTIVVDPGAENANNPGRLVDASTGTDIATDNKPFWFTIDMGSTVTVTGFRIRAYGTNYAPRMCEIYTSNDGTNWESQGQLTTSGSQQYIKFLTAIACRHVKYEIITIASTGRTSVTEFYIYVQ